MCIGCNDARCHGYELFFRHSFFILVYCIALQRIWLMIIIRCFWVEEKNFNWIFRKTKMWILKALFCLFVYLLLFSFKWHIQNVDMIYDLCFISINLIIFCVFFSGFKYFTRFSIRLIDWWDSKYAHFSTVFVYKVQRTHKQTNAISFIIVIGHLRHS